ncbi:MAG TPA: serine hydrolase [Capillimicrobium sp.]|nr:serine hydrolase [Capillimicrobium sp.]
MRCRAASIAAAALLLAGCGGAAHGGASGGRTETVHLMEQTPVNGPPTAAVARRPLDVDLGDTIDRVRVRLRHPPRSGLLFDLDTGEVLWRRAAERVLPIASLTKMMTALVVVEEARRRERVRITRQALAYQGSGVGLLPKGKRVSLEALLYGLMLPSGNDAAIALAQHVGGTVRRFVGLMNARARDLGLSCTRFSAPDGLRDRGNHSCAADLAALARAVLDEPRLARIVRTRYAVLDFPIKGGKLYLASHNPLLLMGYRGATGIKTGYTDAAGRCLVASATRHGRRLGVVLLHSPDPGTQAMRLLDAGFRLKR